MKKQSHKCPGKLPANINLMNPVPRKDASTITELVRESGKVTGYKLSDGRVLSKQEGVSLAKQGGIEPVPTNLALMEQAITRFPWFLALFAVVLAPAYEELLFRRVLFGRLWQAGRPVLGIVLSSLAFALVHEIPGTSANGPWEIAQLWLVYGGMGAAFAWLYQRTGTLWAPIAAHALNNGIALVALMFLGIH